MSFWYEMLKFAIQFGLSNKGLFKAPIKLLSNAKQAGIEKIAISYRAERLRR